MTEAPAAVVHVHIAQTVVLVAASGVVLLNFADFNVSGQRLVLTFFG